MENQERRSNAAADPIAALIVTYNDTVYTNNLCKNLVKQNQINHIVIVDNSDNDHFAYENKKLFYQSDSKIHYIKAENKGYAGGNNIGIRFIMENLSVKYIWIINNDIIPQPSASIEMVKALKSLNNKAICGSILYYYSEENNINVKDDSIVQCYGGGKYYSIIGKSKLHCKGWNQRRLASLKDKNVDFILGASMMIPVAAFEIVGLIPEEYFMYNEELDWQTAAGKKGFKLIVAEDSHIIHLDGLSTKNRRDKYYYYINRATIIFTKKYHFRFILTVLLYRLLEILLLTPGIKNKYSGIRGVINGILF